MKVLLLAAGRSFRMQPIPDKNFLKFFGKPLIQHQLDALKKASFKDILVIGGKHNISVLRKLGVTVREQKNLDLGMAGAVQTAAPWIGKDPFIVMSGNDVFDQTAYELMRKNTAKNEGLLVAYKVKKYFPGGYLKVTPRGVVTTIVEKPGEGREPSKLVNIVMHYHPQPKPLFEELKKNSSHHDGYERALQALFNKKITYRALPFSGFWQPIKYPWHVLSLMDYFLKNFVGGSAPRRNVKIAASAKIHGDVFLEEGVKVLDNAVIVGPAYIGKNTVIATNALVRESSIGENCVIGFGSEVARSYIGDSVWTHANYIGDSVIGSDVSFGSGTVTGNLRLDEKTIPVSVQGEKIDSGLLKFGLVTGSHVRVGINTSFMPGVKIGSNSFIGAGITIAEDIPDNSFARGKWELKISENRERITPRTKP